MKFDSRENYDYSDVLIRPNRSKLASRADVEVFRKFDFLHGAAWSGFPLIAANMDTVGTMAMSAALLSLKCLVSLHKFYKPEELVSFFNSPVAQNSFYTLGISKDDVEKLKIVKSRTKIDRISIDVANGYIQSFIDEVKRTRDENPDAVIMAGTVVTPEITQELISVGADIVRIGIGSGSACKTRDVTGVGMPQLSAVYESAIAAHEVGGLVCADGGCRSSGDIAKALGAGGDFVMLGGMLAGHDECEGDWHIETIDGVDRKIGLRFYGMASDTALKKHYGGVAVHRASEGDTFEVSYKGPVASTVTHIIAGIRSTMTYIGAETLRDIPEKTKFIRA